VGTASLAGFTSGWWNHAVPARVFGMAAGWTREQILNSYQTLKADVVVAGLAYASELLHEEKVLPLKSA
jgi:hypothetical protein